VQGAEGIMPGLETMPSDGKTQDPIK